MNFGKYTRNTVLTFVAAIVFLLSPIGDKEASAASEITTKEVKEVAQKYLGTPYVYGGTSSKGFDCSGYITTVFKELGVTLPRSSASMYEVGDSVDQNDLIPGDLVFFNTSGSGISHVGVYLGGGKFIHSQTDKGVSISNLNDKYYWADRYVGAKRVASVTFE